MDPNFEYIHLDLWVEREADGGYAIRAKSPKGDLRDKTRGPPENLGAHDSRLADNSADTEYVKGIGTRQFGFLMATVGPSTIQRLLDKCQGATNDDCGVLIRLQLGRDDPDIAAIPWEYLYDETSGGYLGSSDKTAVVRYVTSELPRRAPEARLPFKMLVVIPNVTDLKVDEEQARINTALSGIKPPVDVQFLDGVVTWDKLSDALREQHFDFLHFVGHGDVRDGMGCLRFDADPFEPDWVNEGKLRELVKNCRALKLVVLNTCRGAEMSSTRAFGGLGPQLVLAGVPAVVAMQFPITDDEALKFVHAFYHALFQGTERGRVEAAITAARSTLAGEFQGTRAVGLPVLFTRYDEGALFQAETGSRLADAPFGPRAAAAERRLINKVERTLEEFEANPPGPGDTDTQEIVADQRAILSRAKARLRFRNRALALVAVLALVGILALKIGVLDRWSLSAAIAATPIWLGDPLAGKLPVDSIAIVTTSDSVIGWRPKHADLLNRLSQAGARVVAFDIQFMDATADDPVLAAAVDAARARGTSVVDGADSLGSDGLAIAPAFAGKMRTGIDCLGENRIRFSGLVPLIWTPDRARPPHPAFSLAVLAEWRRSSIVSDAGGNTVLLMDSAQQVTDRIRLTKLTRLRSDQRCRIMTAGSYYGELLSVRAPVAAWRDPARRFDYAAVLSLPPERLSWARGKIVLVGSLIDSELSRRRIGLRSDVRFGVERQADAIATMIGHFEPRPAGWGVDLLVMAGLAGLAAWLATRTRRLRGIRAVLGALLPVVGLMLLSIALYWWAHTLLNVLYPALIFLIAYATLLFLRRRVLP